MGSFLSFTINPKSRSRRRGKLDSLTVPFPPLDMVMSCYFENRPALTYAYVLPRQPLGRVSLAEVPESASLRS
ncbi:hypothetical protein BH09PLA1_BH09PLA1_10810 [soil metagenome]